MPIYAPQSIARTATKKKPNDPLDEIARLRRAHAQQQAGVGAAVVGQAGGATSAAHEPVADYESAEFNEMRR